MQINYADCLHSLKIISPRREEIRYSGLFLTGTRAPQLHHANSYPEKLQGGENKVRLFELLQNQN
jgi:hypothetical protein